MKLETTLAKNIRIADDKSKYDEACKRLLAEKMILAWIMKSCLEEYKEYEIKEIAEKYIEGNPQIVNIAIAPDETALWFNDSYFSVLACYGKYTLEDAIHIQKTLDAMAEEINTYATI